MGVCTLACTLICWLPTAIRARELVLAWAPEGALDVEDDVRRHSVRDSPGGSAVGRAVTRIKRALPRAYALRRAKAEGGVRG